MDLKQGDIVRFKQNDIVLNSYWRHEAKNRNVFVIDSISDNKLTDIKSCLLKGLNQYYVDMEHLEKVNL